MTLRHLLSVAVLPFTVTVLVPAWLARRDGLLLVAGPGAARILQQVAGGAVLAAGLLLFATSLRRFVIEGEGTLAPWDPPRRLVLHGPYRHVRNPMISGVIFVLIGEALVLGSRPHWWWALTFLAANAVYIPLLEEPMLAQRFGEAYREYCRHVPRLIPRLSPWRGESPPESR